MDIRTVSYHFYQDSTQVLTLADEQETLYEITYKEGVVSDDWSVKSWRRNPAYFKYPYYNYNKNSDNNPDFDPSAPTLSWNNKNAEKKVIELLDDSTHSPRLAFEGIINKLWKKEVEPQIKNLTIQCPKESSRLIVCEKPSIDDPKINDRLALRLNADAALLGVYVYFHTAKTDFSFSIDIENSTHFLENPAHDLVKEFASKKLNRGFFTRLFNLFVP